MNTAEGMKTIGVSLGQILDCEHVTFLFPKVALPKHVARRRNAVNLARGLALRVSETELQAVDGPDQPYPQDAAPAIARQRAGALSAESEGESQSR